MGSLRMEDCERNLEKVAAFSSQLTDLRTQMSDYYDERHEAFDDVLVRWGDFEKAKNSLKKAKKDFSKGKIDEEEYLRLENEFHFRKRCAKRASKRYKSANEEIRAARKQKQRIENSLRARITGDSDWANII